MNLYYTTAQRLRLLRLTAVLAASSFIGLSFTALSAAEEVARVGNVARAGDVARVRGLGHPGHLQSLAIDGTTSDKTPASHGTIYLEGPDATRQLLVTGHYSSEQVRDLSRDVEYRATPDDIVALSDSGWITPLREGTTTVRVTSGDHATEVDITVRGLIDPTAVNFQNQVVPIFTKFGCNSGGCHGKAGGQNGFQLSLFGFEPQEDYDHLLKESRGRRLFLAAPDRSLVLLKASGTLPHAGGARLGVDSNAYRTIRRWIEEGAVYAGPEAPTIERVEVVPERRILDLESHQQLTLLAHYSNGTIQDVTRMAQFESANRDLASVSDEGLVQTTDLPGNVAVMARFKSHIAVFQATLPLGAPVDNLPESNNFIDRLVFEQLRQLGLPPSELCSDYEFLRRVTVDIAGRLPTKEETSEFLADDHSEKRTQWIDHLLESGDYADYFANKWSALLRNRGSEDNSGRTTYALHTWIRNSFLQNKPYDRFVTEILTASGEAGRDPTVTWYHQVKQSSEIVEDTAQLFLGQRIQCARCHHHPFEKWSQRDYHGMSAFFSRIGRKTSRLEPGKDNIFHRPGKAGKVNPKTREFLTPTGLGSEPLVIAPEDDPRQALAAWMTQPNNPFFARALVNRYWKHFLARGLVEPEDDMRSTNPPTNPELLDSLAEHFQASGFDLKDLVRTICTSRVYQLSSTPNAYNQDDQLSYSRFYPRRLNAEVLSDAIDALTQSTTSFSGTLAGTRATQLPDVKSDSYFLTVFGRPDGNSACECERMTDATLAQSLHLLNSAELMKKVGADLRNRLADKSRSHEDRLRELYMTAYSREPSDSEMKTAVEYISNRQDNTQAAYEDVVTVLINTKEFLFNR